MAIRFTFTKIIPSIIIYAALFLSAIFTDYVLHLLGMKWIGRYLGLVGTLLILSSFVYSLKKRKLIKIGTSKKMLQSHEVLGWIGAVVLVVHGGIHFNSILPWLAEFAMLIVVASGLTGKYLLNDARQYLMQKKIFHKSEGISNEESERELLLQSLLVGTMQKWRKVHMPLTMVFMSFALLHIIVIFVFWRW